jgi:Holliday junction resolvasome RuvABC endonuclease subunit
MVDEDVVKLLSFDPGLAHMGYSCSYYYPDSGKIEVVKHGTVEGAKLLKTRKDMLKEFSKQFTILTVYEEIISDLMMWFGPLGPDFTVSESPFQGQFAQTYAALTLVVNAIRRCSYALYLKDIYVIAPRESKKAITGGGGATKEEVATAVIDNKNIVITSNEELSEHIYDSIAAAYAFVKGPYQELIKINT